MDLAAFAKTDRQRRALESTGIVTVEDLLRDAHGGTTERSFSVGLDKIFDVCNTRLHHLIVRGEDLKRDAAVTISGRRGETTVFYCKKETLDEEELLPPEWFCPLTHEVFRDPVILTDGYTYEEDAIRKWLTSNATSPMTNEDLGPEPRLVPNRSMRDWITRLS